MKKYTATLGHFTYLKLPSFPVLPFGACWNLAWQVAFAYFLHVVWSAILVSSLSYSLIVVRFDRNARIEQEVNKEFKKSATFSHLTLEPQAAIASKDGTAAEEFSAFFTMSCTRILFPLFLLFLFVFT